jgi:coenzyme F420-reducing hydrogenase alpha subunit
VSHSKQRTIAVEALTRVEGEGALRIRLDNGKIDDVQLSIYEPPRYFEAFLRGRSLEDVPDITARICGICPVAYQMTSVHALEKALEIEITPELRRLRRLLYCGEWIESHVLHIFMLNAPDFFDVDSGIDLAKHFPDEINRGLKMKKLGNRLLEILGGRAIHPVNVRVGGFHRLPDLNQLRDLLPDLKWALSAAIESARWIAGFQFPYFDQPFEYVSLQHPDEYPMNEGAIASSHRPTIPVSEYESQFRENQVAHSTALQSGVGEQARCYFVGPLARLNFNHLQLYPEANRLVQQLCHDWPLHNRFYSIVARIIEVVHSFEEAIDLIEHYEQPAAPFVNYSYRNGFGCAATEAPRGLIYHSYQINNAGEVAQAKIVPPTSQNQQQIESDLKAYLPDLLKESDEIVARECEKLIRSYDPCISCSTHFLKVSFEGR